MNWTEPSASRSSSGTRSGVFAIAAGGASLTFARSLVATMPTSLSLRAVTAADLPTLFEHQRDPVATRLAAFPGRDCEAFMAHWAKIMADPACASRAIIYDGHLAGYLGAWTDAETGERLVGYWIGREYWGQGVASAALSQFLGYERTRPLTARVAKHNGASIRVLQKSGFVLGGEERFTGPDGQPVEECLFTLGAAAPGTERSPPKVAGG